MIENSEGKHRPAWEYLAACVSRYDDLATKLNEFGAVGWELVSARKVEGNYECIFKRPK